MHLKAYALEKLHDESPLEYLISVKLRFYILVEHTEITFSKVGDRYEYPCLIFFISVYGLLIYTCRCPEEEGSRLLRNVGDFL
jgi:hypothetical protein